jgi:hypothetical protein
MLPAWRTEAIHHAAQHLQVWLVATGVTYDRTAREAFVRAHPSLFGRAYEVTLHGFEQWRMRHRFTDTVLEFARFIANRHERWLTANGATTGVAPCLLGSGIGQVCWKIERVESIARVDSPAA